MNYSAGIIEYNPDNRSLFIVGHSQQQAIAEFTVPKIINSNNLEDLEISSIPTQEFSTVLNRTTAGNPQVISRITGKKYINQKLVVNAIEYYDAPADNTHTTIIIDDARNIKKVQPMVILR